MALVQITGEKREASRGQAHEERGHAYTSLYEWDTSGADEVKEAEELAGGLAGGGHGGGEVAGVGPGLNWAAGLGFRRASAVFLGPRAYDLLVYTAFGLL